MGIDHSETKTKNSKSILSAKISTLFTFIQLALAIYATSLLFCIIPNIEPSGPVFTLTTRIASQWYSLMNTTTFMSVRHNQQLEDIPVCEYENIDFEQKTSNDTKLINQKKELYQEILSFQSKSYGTETLAQLMSMNSKWHIKGPKTPKITVILNHFKRKTLCSQLDALLQQSLPFHRTWVIAFQSPNEDSFRRIVNTYNDSRISFISSTSYDFKYFGRFQLALQTGSDLVYILDDDMIPGRKMLEILSHVAGTKKYENSVLGSIGRILPFREKNMGFPSYRKPRSKEAGLYLPDPAYGITVNKIVAVDFLSSSWFLSTQLVKALFIENPFTFMTGEDLHLSYQLQKFKNASSYVLPVDSKDKETWGDSEHRIAYISETTVIFKDIVNVRDEQWWRAISGGYETQWAKMYPQKIDALFYAHSIEEVRALNPLLSSFRNNTNLKAYLVVSGGQFCKCENAAIQLKWPISYCRERRFRILDLRVGGILGISNSDVALFEGVSAGMRGLIRIFNPSLLIAVSDIDSVVKNALKVAIESDGFSGSNFVLLPTRAVSKVTWMASLSSSSFLYWNKMKISINIITQNRAQSLMRLLKSLQDAYYIGDKISITFNMDNQVDEETLKIVHDFEWPHGQKVLRRRIIQGGLIRAVSESWYPSSDDDFGLLLEDDIEVSQYYYLWIKYVLLSYHYNPQVSLPQLSSISLYTPRLVEVVKERPRWNATNFFKYKHPNMPYLHQLPCSWGSLFFPKHWREFYTYMTMRFTEDPKINPVQIPGSRTNGWQASWKKFMIDMMYLRGYVTLYPNFPKQASFSTNHMESGAHIGATENVVKHNKEDFEVPLIKEDFWSLLPNGKLPPASKLPSLNLFNQMVSLKGLRTAGAKLGTDVIGCNVNEIVMVDNITGLPYGCSNF